MPQLDFWFDYASNYAYLSAMRIESLCADAGVRLQWRPFLLGPIFQEQGWTTSPFNVYPNKGRYMKRDMIRLAEKRTLPRFTLPPDFPQNSLLAARIGLAGANEDWMGDYTRAVFTRQFAAGQAIQVASDLQDILEELGLPGQSLIERAQTDTTVKKQLREQTTRAGAAGIFGAPSFVTGDNELFWGDDRLDDAIAWATQSA